MRLPITFSLSACTSSASRPAPFGEVSVTVAPLWRASSCACSLTIWANSGVVANQTSPAAPTTTRARKARATHSIVPRTSR